MISIIISLLIITLVIAGVSFYSLEGNKVETQPIFIEADPNEDVLDRLHRINQD